MPTETQNLAKSSYSAPKTTNCLRAYTERRQISPPSLLASNDADALSTDHILFESYFDQLYQLVPVDSDIQNERGKLHFRKVAELARVIKDETQAVIVPYGKGIDLINNIQTRTVTKDRPRFDRKDMRKLQRFLVNLRSNDFQRLLSQRAITRCCLI